MNLNKTRFNVLQRIFLAVCVAFNALLAGCSLMHDTNPPCATDPNVTTIIDFVYDYNMDGVDSLYAHVGSIYLYVFDGNDVLVHRRELRKSWLGVDGEFKVIFDSSEIKPGRIYQVYAVAEGNYNGHDETTPGFTLVNGEMIEGVSTINDFGIQLQSEVRDVDNDGELTKSDVFRPVQDERFDNFEHIDTVWVTKDPQTIAITPVHAGPDDIVQIPDIVHEVTVPLLRITNYIDIRVSDKNGNLTTETDTDDFNLVIHFPQGNGLLNITGNRLEHKDLWYRAMRKTMIASGSQEQASALSRAGDKAQLRAEFGVSRLQERYAAELQIYDRDFANQLIEPIDIYQYILDAQSSVTGMDNDEYLDREYNFQIDLEFDDILSEQPKLLSLTVYILGWAKRYQFVTLQ